MLSIVQTASIILILFILSYFLFDETHVAGKISNASITHGRLRREPISVNTDYKSLGRPTRAVLDRQARCECEAFDSNKKKQPAELFV